MVWTCWEVLRISVLQLSGRRKKVEEPLEAVVDVVLTKSCCWSLLERPQEDTIFWCQEAIPEL
jgi:hypothetical protein